MEKLTMADVLAQSWGGPEFPAYEGRLDGEGAMDSGERTEAALAAFSADDTVTPAEPVEKETPAEAVEAQPDPNDANAREQTQAEPVVEGQLTDEQIQADPRFQELSTLRDDVVNALSEFPGLVDDKGAPNLAEAGLQLKDASVLYDIMAGRGTPSALLETMAQNAGWTDGQKQAVAQDLIGWLTKSGYLKDGGAGPAKKAGEPGFKDPVQERLDKIEQDRAAERQTAEQQRVDAHRKEVFETKFSPEVGRLCKQKGVPAEDVPDYALFIASQIKGNKAITDRIEKGNFVDINKFFTARYNAEVKRLQRWTSAQTKAAEAKEKNPKIPAGGASPRPVGSAKTMNTKDRDSRIAAATEMF